MQQPSGKPSGDSPSAEKTPFSAPSISLPMGGGAIKGMGEKFQVNPVTGTGSLGIPMPLSPGRGFTPQLGLGYDSGAGNGAFGLGWNLSLPSIGRKTERGLPQYRDAAGADTLESDVFVLSGAEDLVPTDGKIRDGYWVQQYQPRIEGMFARIERWTRQADGDTHWRSITAENVTTFYGKTLESRIADPTDPLKVFSWLVCEGHDDKGNAFVYEYIPEDSRNVDVRQANEQNRTPPSRTANRYLKRVRYGNVTSHLLQPNLAAQKWLFELVFDYDENHLLVQPTDGNPSVARASLTPRKPWTVRKDSFSSHRSTFELRTYRLCRRVLMFHHFPDELSIQDYLVRAIEFEYDEQGIAAFMTRVQASGFIHQSGDQYTRRSTPPLEFEYSKAEIQEEVRDLDADGLENLPVGLDDATYQWVDLNGEGVSGILTEQANAWFYKPNLGAGRFGPLELVTPRPSLAALSRGRQQLLDLTGNGQIELVAFGGPTPGYFERSSDATWENFRTFKSMPNVAWDDPNLRFIDLTGDGRADILLTEHEVLTWYPFEAEVGFTAAEQTRKPWDEATGPRLVFWDGTQTIFLADMSGDGLTDFVRIRNGEVCYWPNLGYGRFGGKITMDNSPWFDFPDLFDQRRIRLADTDGTGISDIVYLGTNAVQVYFNQSGNAWGDAQTLESFPHTDTLSQVHVIDLLGDGTACLVWSSPQGGPNSRQMRYTRLFLEKPHLMVRVRNNLGVETTMRYVASTKFYLQDKLEGKPWITRLPFPVHVLEHVESVDLISKTRFASRYSYHHGYFDGIEREFRGFAMVEQHDTEAFEDHVIGVKRIEGTQELAPELNQPPVTTRTWFHTGAMLDRERILHQLREEYHRKQQLIPEPILPSGLDDEEFREALRALKGLPLRQEVYSFDGSSEEQHPYQVVESGYEVKLLKPRTGRRYAVFLTHGSEVITQHFERNPSDPRIAHGFTLELDQYGHVVRSASVVYGRQIVDASLPAEVTRDQQQLHVTYGELDFTDDQIQETPEVYRLRVPFDSRGFEITGIKPNAARFTLEEIKNKIAAATVIAYDKKADGTTAEKRLLAQNISLFLDNNLAPLPLGKWDTLGLGHKGYQLAFTPDVIASHYNGQITEADMITAGYFRFNNDPNWWIPSGTAVYPDDPKDHFYIPIGAKDPTGLETRATFDKYNLLTEKVEVIQAIWNVMTAQNDYRVLGPISMTDANGNRSAVEIDELGMVVKSAAMGKLGSSDGDTLADPTVRMEYGLFNWMDNHKPNFVHSFAREQHGVGNPRWQESYAYSNGSGGVAMVKAQAHPGKALKPNPDGTVSEVDANPRWVGNGRTILNNKGNPVKQYEPFFSTTHEYEDEKALREIGFTSVVFYDALGRNTRTVFPSGTFAKVEFTAWMQRAFDLNDTVIESQWYADRGSPNPNTDPEPNDPEHRAAWLSAKHANTPGTVHSDSLGRSVYSISDYGAGKTATVRSETDMTGRYSRLFDQKGRVVASGFTGMAGTPIFGQSAERGKRWTFLNAIGNLVKTWDEHGREFRTRYDELHRPVSVFVKEPDHPEILFDHIVYGDRLPNAKQLNLLGVPYQVFDQAGMKRVPELDFKGNPTRLERVLAKDYKNNLDWSSLENLPDVASIQNVANSFLETGEVFTASAVTDALNRPTRAVLPDNTVIVPAYNEANMLASLKVQIRGQGNFIEFLKNQDYDAKGQRQFAHYGNDVFTRYFYDPKTFHLTHLLTHNANSDPETQGLQNLRYTYDPVGNITQIRDDAQQTRFFNNAVVKPENLYEYDAIYQLIRASGREHAAAGNNSIRNHNDLEFVPQLPHVNDLNAVRTYSQEYEYDVLGNITKLKHSYKPQAGGSGWVRYYQYALDTDPNNRTNRLIATSAPGDVEAGPYGATYQHDVYGNMTKMPHLAEMSWNFMDQLRRVDLGGGGTAYYVYGTGGQRIRKVIERQGSRRTERIYLGAVEIYRERQGSDAPDLERHTVHVSDNTGRIAQVDIKIKDDNNTDPDNPLNTVLIRYQYTNHLGSAVLETDENGTPISYEEYHPYGTSAYRSGKPRFSLSLKRYRFSGKERDNETGFDYFGARYYASWIGRWTSSDPGGFIRGFNLFRFCSNSPIVFLDPNGMEDGMWHVEKRQWETLNTGGDSGGAVDTRAEFERWAVATGVEYTGTPTFTTGDGWTVEKWKSVRPGTGGARTELTPVEESSGGSVPVIPARPLVQPGPVPGSPIPTNPIPKLDFPQAPTGTDFAAEESAARAAYRANAAAAGTPLGIGEQVQHPAKWRDGARTNLDPRITNDPEFLHPIQSRVDQMGGETHQVDGKTYGTDHTYADRGIYPREARDTQRRYGSLATERVTHVWAGQRSRRTLTGSRGPTFIREYIVAPMLRGAAGHFALSATRTFVPGVAETEMVLMSGGMYLSMNGYAAAGGAAMTAASYVPVVGGSLVAGAIAGNAAESLAQEFGASTETAQAVGISTAVLTGAAVGALIGSVLPVVGTGAGAAIGAIAGGVGYALSKFL